MKNLAIRTHGEERNKLESELARLNAAYIRAEAAKDHEAAQRIAREMQRAENEYYSK